MEHVVSTHAEAEGSSAQDAPTPADDDAPTAPDRTAEEDAPADRTTDGGEAAESATAEGSEAAAEIAAQREVRERIERRKAEKDGPVDSGAKLSGTAAELLAAVRAVESGERPARSFTAPTPPPPAPGPTAPPRTGPAAAPAETAPPPAAVDAVRAVLAAGGAPQSLAAPVAADLGENAADRLREDPWHLLRVPGVLPEQADGFARALLGPDCRPDDARRGRALTVWLLERAALAGHTALEVPALRTALAGRSVPEPDEALQSAVAEGEVLVFQDALEPAGTNGSGGTGPGAADDGAEAERPVRVLVGLERLALAEESLADGLARLLNAPAESGSPAQPTGGPAAELLAATAASALVLHTGGEAARTELAALVTAALATGRRVVAAAHTADGRDRFAALLAASDGTVPEGVAVTVPGLLSAAEGPGRDAEGALAADLLVVLDTPHLDVEGAALLVELLADGARLVLGGDPATLWSVGPGRVFADLLASRTCPHVASRTPDPGPLGELTSGIAFGELTRVEAPGKEVVIVPVQDPAEAVHRAVQLVVDSVPRALGIPSEQTRVITPGHGGGAGTRALNAALKERLNPGPGRFGGFDPGDCVVWSPAPGRTVPGLVAGADAEGLRLTSAEGPVLVPREHVERTVRHGWALTAHQTVGHRWPAVVVVLPPDAAGALDRAWVYTAFSRGERHLSVVHGVEQALPQAVAAGAPRPRTTRLPLLLRGQGPAASAEAG
ncbi:helix-hairpin-helix domain-containing protein [Streptomyces sp. LE64]|uniref:helix-hairpin-helix domain-containing protein n=1 Tax=Streptomyces sp. LE64 TaxID=3448653 RepID=UPI00404282AB